VSPSEEVASSLTSECEGREAVHTPPLEDLRVCGNHTLSMVPKDYVGKEASQRNPPTMCDVCYGSAASCCRHGGPIVCILGLGMDPCIHMHWPNMRSVLLAACCCGHGGPISALACYVFCCDALCFAVLCCIVRWGGPYLRAYACSMLLPERRVPLNSGYREVTS